MGSCLGCSCLQSLNKKIFSSSFGEKHKNVISKLFNNNNNDKTKNENSELSVVKLNKYTNKNNIDSTYVNMRTNEENKPIQNSSDSTNKNVIKKLDVTEYLADSQSTTTSTTGSSRSISKNDFILTENEAKIQTDINHNNNNNNNNNNLSSSSTFVNQDLKNINDKNDDNFFVYDDDCENSWNNDKLIDENFNLKFDINQININLIGKCQHSSSSSSSSSDSSSSSNSTSVSNSRFSSGRSRMSLNFNNNKSDSNNLITDNKSRNKTPPSSSQIVKCFIKNLNKNNKHSTNSSVSKQIEEKIHHKHNNDKKYLFFVQKINQVNVDGFEWDLV